MWSKTRDLRKRLERLGISFTIYTPMRHFRIVDNLDYRTYTAPQMRSLLKNVKELEVVETYDFSYEIDSPIVIDAKTEDVVFVLRKH